MLACCLAARCTAGADVSAHAGADAGEETLRPALPPPRPLLAALANVTALYKGSWRVPPGGAGIPPLEQRGGVALLRLARADAPAAGGRRGKRRRRWQAGGGVAADGANDTAAVQELKGELVLRDGRYVTDADLSWAVQGVYVSVVGRFLGVATPARRDIRLPRGSIPPAGQRPLPQQQEQAAVAPGAAAEKQGAAAEQEWEREQERRSAVRELAARLAAAAAAAAAGEDSPEQRWQEWRREQQWRRRQAGGGAGATEAEEFSKGLLPEKVLEAAAEAAWETKACEFTLDLSFAPANTSDGESGGEGGGAGAAPALGRRAGPPWRHGTAPPPQLAFAGVLSSAGCRLALAVNGTTTDFGVYMRKASSYAAAYMLVVSSQVALAVRQMAAGSSPTAAGATSLLCLLWQAGLDAYLCLLHLTFGIVVDALFNTFSLAAFLGFVLFAGEHIVHSAAFDGRQPLRPQYVLGMSAARLAVPLYVWGCPSNLLRVPPSPGFCLLLVAWVGAQAAVLVAQFARGPRCFVPAALLPPRYDYHRPALPRRPQQGGATDGAAGAAPGAAGAGGLVGRWAALRAAVSRAAAARGGGGGEAAAPDLEPGEHAPLDCAICMNPVDVVTPQRRMVTPCHHFYHPHCLRRWMERQQSCPICRHALPLP
eukprot:scaffold5.g955.t1